MPPQLLGRPVTADGSSRRLTGVGEPTPPGCRLWAFQPPPPRSMRRWNQSELILVVC
jgi:hypothetical protein